jgi:hypothetical protein
MSDEMRRALEADGEKLRQLTGRDHGPFDSLDAIIKDKPVKQERPAAYEPPGYDQPGRIVFEILQVYALAEKFGTKNYEVGRTLCDSGGASFWVQEGGFVDYWIDDRVDLEQPGTYVIESVTGTYHRGDWYTTDDDVEWHLGNIRYATDEEAKELE